MIFWGKVISNSMEIQSAEPPKGLICPLVTPLKGSHVDTASLQRLIEHILGSVDAVLLNGPVWGEGLALSREERLNLVEAALDIVRGRCPVLISITGNTAKETSLILSEFDHLIYRYNYPGSIFWVDAPICYHSNRNLPQFYKALTLETPFEFFLYNDPYLVRRFKKSMYHKNIRTSVLKKLSENNRISGLIYTGTIKRSLDYQRAVRYHQDFRIYDGDEKNFLDRPSSNGVLAGGSNFLPIAWREVTYSSLNVYDTQRTYSDHVYQIWEAGNMLRKFYNLYCKEPAVIVKQILQIMGIISDGRTVDSGKLSNNKVEHIEKLVRKHKII
jgi:dihydrodipicolinate synthase/N-acetylneuraminate lyase